MEPLSRKDYFAAAAMQGLLAGRNPNAQAYSTAEIARVAAECANYMILALEQTAPVAPPAPPAPVAPPPAPVAPPPAPPPAVPAVITNDPSVRIIH